ncbi:alkaline phosphatase D family protein [Micromonospora inositola]|uniref:Phosphodiesterase/alkaline phosphatase D n=1 Tax=Micromonospora inositola TaxID=47865 RepID=A0A1C5K2B9_9ACTN|nr:alkaline phosphatase D family protein [Micromonospora inositola]SCG76960.1 Phosphodiesterase/alkaline phosphatase D [Micromonospora inositola]
MADASPISRRRFLAIAGGTAGMVAVSQLVAELPAAYADELDPAPFALGVASGEPDHESVVLWTRLVRDPLNAADGGMPPDPVQVQWEVARDPQFRQLVRSAEVTAAPNSAHTLHVLVGDLAPGRWYWYRFRADGVYSRTGRTRTMPPPGDTTDHMRFAFVSCQSWVGGPFPAYRDLAEQDLDFVIHLGDYIYETTNGSLTEFRRLHALYKTSPDLRAAHARFPFILTWDDHEVQNNYAGPIPPNPADGRPFLERRANGYQAYYEHLPLRPEQRPSGPDMLMYRRLNFGRLAQFSVLDTRQYRSDQALGDGRKEPTGEVFDPTRTMTGPEQESWLLDGLLRSKARWNVVAQQTIMAAFDYDLGPGQIVNLDQWDGYPPARSRILDFIATHQVPNPVVLSGDWHTHWVNDLKTDFADPGSKTIATEFVGTSISFGAGWDADVRAGLAANPHVKFYNGGYRGYVICDVTEKRWRADLRIVLSARDAASPAYTIAAFEVRDGVPGAYRIDAGDGIVGRVTDAATGAALLNVQVTVTRTDGSQLVASTTDPSGEVLAFAPPGNYTVAVNGVGYEPVSHPVTVVQGIPTELDLRLHRASTRAGTGRIVPGPQSEAGTSDLVLGNDLVALAVSAGTDDPQLSGVTVGKPLDLAAVGRLDQLDWINLPYASATQPRGGNAWQQRTVRSTAVEVLSATAPVASVRAMGTSTALPDLQVVTTYTIRPNEPWVAAESVFTNLGTVPRSFWTGDALDHDGAGQRSGVAGHGTITSGTPADYPPTAPWIGMTGSDRQTYGLLYEDTSFVAYAAYNWVMSQRQVTLAPGETFTLRRRIVAVDSGDGADPFAVLGQL